MVTGTIVGYGLAWAPGERADSFQIVRPGKTVANLEVMGQEGKRWRETARGYRSLANRGQLEPRVAARAEFVEEVLAIVAERVRTQSCCVLVAQSLSGRILGVVYYALLKPDEGAINLQGTDPAYLPGAPEGKQIRGIGTSLVAAASRDMLHQGVTTIFLHPLDNEAAVFWSGRGFRPCGAGGLMCVRGREAVEGLLGSCQAVPDCPDQGDCVVCGLPEHTEEMRSTRR